MFIVTKKINSENISKLCRTCLREDGEKMVYLFVGPAGSSLAAKLRSLSCLEVWQGDGLPEKMCDRCVTRAESALLFREQCRAADRALRQAALKVAGVTSYTTVSGCKLYQENQGFVPLQNLQRTLKCIECGAVFVDYHELLAHNRLHSPFCQEPNSSYRIFNPENSYDTSTNVECPNAETNRPATLHSPIGNSCALHCSLCNDAFTSKLQTINQSFPHSSNNVDLSCDEESIEIGDNSSYLGKNLAYERPLECDNPTQNLSSYPQNVQSQNTQGIKDNQTCNKSKERKYKCEQCGKAFFQKSKLQTHLIVHSGRRPFCCKVCSKAYASKSKLNAHQRLHTRTNVHQCRICDKIFSYPSYLEEHLKVHETKVRQVEKCFECSFCSKSFQLEKSLKSHLKIHSESEAVRCEHCDKTFAKEYNLKVHLQIHQVSKPHKCDVCDKLFSHKSNLLEHSRIHRKTKPFSCKLCGKSFAQSSHLKSHLTSHDSIRRHQCKVCGKRFKLGSHLKRHINLHTGAKVYKCDKCELVLSHAFSLKRHYSKRHGESGT